MTADPLDVIDWDGGNQPAKRRNVTDYPARPRGVVVIGLLLLALAAAGIVVWRGM
jgi:hypothetical protein